jgi:hypothetical protein
VNQTMEHTTQRLSAWLCNFFCGVCSSFVANACLFQQVVPAEVVMVACEVWCQQYTSVIFCCALFGLFYLDTGFGSYTVVVGGFGATP